MRSDLSAPFLPSTFTMTHCTFLPRKCGALGSQQTAHANVKGMAPDSPGTFLARHHAFGSTSFFHRQDVQMRRCGDTPVPGIRLACEAIGGPDVASPELPNLGMGE